MSVSIDVFWSFRSPYSYLVISQLKQLQEDFGVAINIRPVYPLAVREVSFFENRRPQQIAYMALDMVREANKLGLPFRWPQPDPIVQNMATMTVAKDQPLIDRLMLLGVLAQRDKGPAAFPFFEVVSGIIFDGNTDNWHEGDHLAKAAITAGLDLGEMERTVETEKASLLLLIEKNEAEQQKYHWGVPLMLFNGEPFFGQDRVETLRWRLEERNV